jgi:hypothetical protein
MVQGATIVNNRRRIKEDIRYIEEYGQYGRLNYYIKLVNMCRGGIPRHTKLKAFKDWWNCTMYEKYLTQLKFLKEGTKLPELQRSQKAISRNKKSIFDEYNNSIIRRVPQRRTLLQMIEISDEVEEEIKNKENQNTEFKSNHPNNLTKIQKDRQKLIQQKVQKWLDIKKIKKQRHIRPKKQPTFLEQLKDETISVHELKKQTDKEIKEYYHAISEV